MQHRTRVFLSRNGVVLIVEDDDGLRELYSSALRFAGFDIDVAGDGLAALHRLDDGAPPDAVVLDLGLPRLGGLTVADELLAQTSTRNVPIVVVTGDTAPIDEKRFAAVIRKPARPERVVAAVEDCLRAAHTARGTSTAS